MWTGAASFIELGTTVPKNGGIQEYLRRYYGDAYDFLFVCTWIFVVNLAPWLVYPWSLQSISTAQCSLMQISWYGYSRVQPL